MLKTVPRTNAASGAILTPDTHLQWCSPFMSGHNDSLTNERTVVRLYMNETASFYSTFCSADTCTSKKSNIEPKIKIKKKVAVRMHRDLPRNQHESSRTFENPPLGASFWTHWMVISKHHDARGNGGQVPQRHIQSTNALTLVYCCHHVFLSHGNWQSSGLQLNGTRCFSWIDVFF